MRPITSPHIRDTITIDGDFALDVAGFAGPDPLVLVARLVDQQAELRIGARSVVIVADEFRGNGQLVNAAGTGSQPPLDWGLPVYGLVANNNPHVDGADVQWRRQHWKSDTD